jgi:hypothetical protein
LKTETDRAVARFVRRATPDDPWEVVFFQPSGASITSPPAPTPQAAGTVAGTTPVSGLDESNSIRIPPGTTEDVYVSHFSNPGLVFVHLAKNHSVLDNLSDALQAFYENGAGATNSAYELTSGGGQNTGQLVAAQSCEDSRWYRGEILQFMGQKAKVWYIDYGNEDEVAVEGIRVLDSQFSALPKQVSQSIDTIKASNFGPQRNFRLFFFFFRKAC